MDNYEVNNKEISIKIVPIGSKNDWCLIILFDNKEQSNYVENGLGEFELYLAVNPKRLTMVINMILKNEIISLYAPVNNVQYNIVKDRHITHVMPSYDNNILLIESRVFSVTPKFEVE